MSEHAAVTDFVLETLGRLTVPLERLFVVPGNHDIHRKTNLFLRRPGDAIDRMVFSKWVAGLGARQGARTVGELSAVGAMDRALDAAAEQAAMDKARGADWDSALAVGLRADILKARGELDEAPPDPHASRFAGASAP